MAGLTLFSVIKRRWVIASSAVMLFALAACDRITHEQGGADKSAKSSVTYQTEVLPKSSTLAASSNVADVAPQLGGGAVDGAKIYATVCQACHQPNGQGVPGAFPPLDGSGYVTSNNIERLASLMLYGLQGPVKVKGTVYASMMPGQGATLKDEELAAAASYIRNSWSNKAIAIEPTVFTKMRAKWGQRGPFTIEELGVEPSEQ